MHLRSSLPAALFLGQCGPFATRLSDGCILALCEAAVALCEAAVVSATKSGWPSENAVSLGSLGIKPLSGIR